MTNVGDIPLPGNIDALGQHIRCMYNRKPPQYAVYRINRRVMIHFADDKEEENRQRRTLAELAPIRGEIDGLVDGWRDGTSHRFLGIDNRGKLRSKAARYDRRVADALVVALDDDVATAKTLLTKIREDIVNERVAWARFEYLVAAFASALAVMFVAWLLSAIYPLAFEDAAATETRMESVGILILVLSFLVAAGVYLGGIRTMPRESRGAHEEGAEEDKPPHGQEQDGGNAALGMLSPALVVLIVAAIPVFSILIYPSFTYAPISPAYDFAIDLWQAAAAGAVGAFFSIALAIRGRTVLPDLQRTANLMDAVLRVTIGFIAGAVVMALIRAGVVDLHFGDQALRDENAVLPVLITGFIAGFSERLVPDLLEKASFKPTDPSAPAATAPARRADGGTTSDAAPSTPPADEPDPVPEQATEDACAADVDVDDDEVTADSELPAATGGVARPEGGAQ